MSNFILSCCSTADLSEKHFNDRDIKYICFHFFMDGKPYMDDLGKSIPYDEFYKMIADGHDVKTSQINADEYAAYFEPFLKEGRDILHVALSSGLSGTINSANIAAAELKEKYPDRKIMVVDSLAAASGYGLLMDKLADLRDEGKTIEEVASFVEENRLYLHHWFFSTDLTSYVKGGRISKAAGTFGTLLNICPLLNVDLNGKLVPRMKVRTKRKVIEEIVKKMEENAIDGLDYSGKCYICNSACEDDAKAVASLVESKFEKLDGKVQIYSIGTTIGCHTGPGTVALFFWGKKRED